MHVTSRSAYLISTTTTALLFQQLGTASHSNAFSPDAQTQQSTVIHVPRTASLCILLGQSRVGTW